MDPRLSHRSFLMRTGWKGAIQIIRQIAPYYAAAGILLALIVSGGARMLGYEVSWRQALHLALFAALFGAAILTFIAIVLCVGAAWMFWRKSEIRKMPPPNDNAI